MKPACVLSLSTPATLAMPKSAIFTWPSHGMSTFDGLTSRWMTGDELAGLRVAAPRAPRASAPKTRDADEDRGAVVEALAAGLSSARSLWSGSPSTYSSTMTSCPSSEKKS